MNLQDLRRGIQIQQGEGAHELIIQSGLSKEDLLPLIDGDLENYPSHAVDYYKAGLLSRTDAKDYYNEFSPKHVVSFYEASLISLEEARQGLDDMREKYGTNHLIMLYKAGVITLEEIEPFAHSIFFNHSHQREDLLELKLIDQALYDEYDIRRHDFDKYLSEGDEAM